MPFVDAGDVRPVDKALSATRRDLFSPGKGNNGLRADGATEASRLRRTTLREMAEVSGMTWTWNYAREWNRENDRIDNDKSP